MAGHRSEKKGDQLCTPDAATGRAIDRRPLHGVTPESAGGCDWLRWDPSRIPGGGRTGWAGARPGAVVLSQLPWPQHTEMGVQGGDPRAPPAALDGAEPLGSRKAEACPCPGPSPGPNPSPCPELPGPTALLPLCPLPRGAGREGRGSAARRGHSSPWPRLEFAGFGDTPELPSRAGGFVGLAAGLPRLPPAWGVLLPRRRLLLPVPAGRTPGLQATRAVVLSASLYLVPDRLAQQPPFAPWTPPGAGGTERHPSRSPRPAVGQRLTPLLLLLLLPPTGLTEPGRAGQPACDGSPRPSSITPSGSILRPSPG